jgi:hypothetical protein
LGGEVVFNKLISNANVCGLQLDLCLPNENSRELILESGFMELTVLTTAVRDQMHTSSHRESGAARAIQCVGGVRKIPRFACLGGAGVLLR